MNMSTELSSAGPDGVCIRGYPLTALMAEASFAEVVHLLLRGELPDRATARMIEAILVSAVDHGPNAPSVHIARATASCGVPLATAVGNGIAAIGRSHGGAGESCARILQSGLVAGIGGFVAADYKDYKDYRDYRDDAKPEESGTAGREFLGRVATSIVESARSSGSNLPGYGHRVYKVADPRTGALLALAAELGLSGDHCRLALLVEAELERVKGKRLVLNVDGAQAAVLSDLGFSWRQVQPLFIIGRSVGLCAHVAEEIASGAPLAFLKSAPATVEYTGPEPREYSRRSGLPST